MSELKKKYVAARAEFLKIVSNPNWIGYYDEVLLRIIKKHGLTLVEYQGCSKVCTE